MNARTEVDRVPAGSNWADTMSHVFYYGVPALLTLAVICLITYGSGWLQGTVGATGWLFSLIFGTPEGDLGMRTVAAFAIINIFISAMRLSAALKIPPEATLGQNIDRGISVIPVITMLVLMTWAKAKGWTYDPIAWKCLLIALWNVLLLDFWIAGLAQKQVAAYRRRLDVV